MRATAQEKEQKGKNKKGNSWRVFQFKEKESRGGRGGGNRGEIIQLEKKKFRN